MMFLLIRAARYLGVAPWKLAVMPSMWLNWALVCESAEALAEAAAMAEAQRKAGKGKR